MQRATALHDSSSEHGANTKLATYSLGINFPGLKPGDGTLSHHSQFRQGRQNINQAPSDTVAEVFVFRIATRISEGQNCQRVDDLGNALVTRGSGLHGRSEEHTSELQSPV